MASASAKSSQKGMGRSQSSGALPRSPDATLTKDGEGQELPKIPKHLSVSALTRKRKLPKNTCNQHGFMAEDYSQLNWPLPKMFGQEKYAYSLIDIEDPRYLQDCAAMSKKLIRLTYDQQIIDLEWRKTYKALLDAEHHLKTLPPNAAEKTKKIMKDVVDQNMKYLLELQEQKDMYETCIQDVWSKCASIKATIKKETDLEDLRMALEKGTKEKIPRDSQFWRTKFNMRSPNHTRSATGITVDLPPY
mmetsp:Transcript_31677/g.73991  ORF Transcript_31677/g.73991 Transcript_31677/m.73991 type:complete len:247 (+) Transcript_31677:90-830(+)